MSQPDFYAIFGVPPSASQDEIRAAHRELVKRYHPDIYSTGGDIARATEKLREINEAYAVLGNAERRKKYDASRVEQRRSASVAQQRPSYVRVRSSARPKAPARPIRARKKLQGNKFFTFRLLAGAIAGAILFVVTAYFLTRAPDVLPAWVLWHKTEVEPPARGPIAATNGWERLGSFGVKAECARVLKTHVKADQEQGSRAVFDESNGTMAITVFLSESDAASNPKKLLEGQRPVTKRVRHYECRAVQVRQPDSWLRRKMRQAGLVP